MHFSSSKPLQKERDRAIHSLDLWMRTVCAHLKRREKKQHLSCNRKWKQFSFFRSIAIWVLQLLPFSMLSFAHFIRNDNKAHLGNESLKKKNRPTKAKIILPSIFSSSGFLYQFCIRMCKCGLSFHFNPAIKYICSWIFYMDYVILRWRLSNAKWRDREKNKNCNKMTTMRTAMEMGEKRGAKEIFRSFIHSLSLSSFYQRIVNCEYNGMKWWTMSKRSILCLCPTLAVIIIALGLHFIFMIVFSFSLLFFSTKNSQDWENDSGSSIPFSAYVYLHVFVNKWWISNRKWDRKKKSTGFLYSMAQAIGIFMEMQLCYSNIRKWTKEYREKGKC